MILFSDFCRDLDDLSFLPVPAAPALLPLDTALATFDLLVDDTLFFAGLEERLGVDVLLFRAGVRARTAFNGTDSCFPTLGRTLAAATAAAAAAAARAGVRRGVGCAAPCCPALVDCFFAGVVCDTDFFRGVRDDLLFPFFLLESMCTVMKRSRDKFS